MAKKEKRSEVLSRLWPAYFSEIPTEKELLDRCKSILEDIDYRYNVECNSLVTRKQINIIGKTLSDIYLAKSKKD